MVSMIRIPIINGKLLKSLILKYLKVIDLLKNLAKIPQKSMKLKCQTKFDDFFYHGCTSEDHLRNT